jgi:hypothetical protein
MIRFVNGLGRFFTFKNLNMIKIGEKKYFEISEYAKSEGVTIQTVYNRINSDQIKTKKLLGKVLIEL